uniref:Uncharacterized protein n=1 Tax=Oryza brachyantha TaxID=4533 RepID=J3M329_ORYBR
MSETAGQSLHHSCRSLLVNRRCRTLPATPTPTLVAARRPRSDQRRRRDGLPCSRARPPPSSPAVPSHREHLFQAFATV